MHGRLAPAATRHLERFILALDCRHTVELDGAKLFFPEERPDALASALREHWHAAEGMTVAPA